MLDCAEMVRCYGRCLQRGRDGREDEEALLRYREQLFNIAKSVSDNNHSDLKDKPQDLASISVDPKTRYMTGRAPENPF